MIRKPIKISISEINDAPGPYCMSFDFSLNPLMNSIKRFGIINPPLIVFEKAEDRAQVVSGYRRVLALKNLGEISVECIDLTNRGLSKVDLLMLSLSENLSTRKLNAVEKAMVLKRLSSFLPEKDVLSFMPELELPPDPFLLNIYIDIESQEYEIKISFAREEISIRTMEFATRKFDHESRNTIIKFMSKLKLSFNNQLQFVDIIKDITFNKKIEVGSILKDKGILEILQNEKMNRAQKGKAIMNILNEIRYPLLSKMRRKFSGTVSRLDLPPGTRIIPPPFFESDQFTIEVRFSSSEELKEKLTRIIDKTDQIGAITEITK